MHTPPFAQEEAVQSSMFSSHLSPVNPVAVEQSHVNSLIPSTHVPPLLHGFIVGQSSMLLRQLSPVNPEGHSQVNVLMPSMQTFPFWQGSSLEHSSMFSSHLWPVNPVLLNSHGPSQNTVPIASTQVAIKGIVQYSTKSVSWAQFLVEQLVTRHSREHTLSIVGPDAHVE